MKRFRLKPPKTPEHELQRQVARILTLALGPDIYWSSVDHAAAASAAVGAQRKARGVRAGIPDIEIVHKGQYHGIELKAEGGKVSANQIDTHFRIINAGGKVATCNSVDSVLAQLRSWSIPIKVRLAV